MSRIRSIKPEFFLHEGLAELPAAARLLFIGLWTLADKEGRLEDRPKRIKAQIFPYDDDCNIDGMLSALADAGHVVRYQVGDLACIAIPGFLEHQRPHPKETSYDLPAPPSVEFHGKPGKEPASRGKDSPSKVEVGAGMENGGGCGKDAGACAPPPAPKEQKPLLDAPDLVDAMRADWNRLAPPGCPRWQTTPKGRRTAALARLAEHKGDLQPLAWWRDLLDRVARSQLLRGDKGGWRAAPDWLLKPASIAKVLEGTYDDRPAIVRHDPEPLPPPAPPEPDPIPDDLEPVDAVAVEKLIVGAGGGVGTEFLAKVRAAGRRGDTLFLLVPDKFNRDFIDDHFGAALRQRFSDQLGADSITWLCNPNPATRAQEVA